MTDGEIRASYRQAKYPDEQVKILAQLTDRSVYEIKVILGLKPPKRIRPRWTVEDIEFLKANTHLTDSKIGKMLNKKTHSVTYKRNQLGLPIAGYFKHWSKEELEFLIDSYRQGVKVYIIAEKLDRTPSAVSGKLNILRNQNKL